MQAKKVKFFNEDGIELLKKACKKRNYVVHNLFRDDLKPRHLETDPEFYFEEFDVLEHNANLQISLILSNED